MCIILLLVAVVSVCQAGTSISGSQCRAQNSQPGTCRLPEDCVSPKGIASSCPDTSFVCCPNSGISGKKCEEYSQYVYTKRMTSSLMTKTRLKSSSECGVEGVPLIIGGTAAHNKEFPHMVSIGYGPKNNINWMCGGTLISDSHVLSAAHCAVSKEKGPASWAGMGAIDLTQTESLTVIGISNRILHPRYKPPSRYNDIMIFVLNTPATFSGTIRPACLNVLPEVPPKMIASGWGKTKYSSSRTSAALMKVAIEHIDSTQCNQTYKADIGGRPMTFGVIDSQLCAGQLSGGKDTCQGDSGGPLQIVLTKPFCMYSVIGVTSFGKFCGFKNSPAIYTRVSTYIPWVESVVWPRG